MSTLPATERIPATRRLRDRLGDRLLLGLTLAAAIAVVALMIVIVYKVLQGAHPAFSRFGFSFLWSSDWDANIQKNLFGALPGLYGTAVTSAMALIIAVPLAIAIALFLSELAPRGVRGVVGSLVELLAAIPSVVLGLWGILVMAPFVSAHVEPWLHRWFGFIPLFSGKPGSSGLFMAGLILAIMVVPIIASICRELFLSVPRELEEGAIALGSTRWEMVRNVAIPQVSAGLIAAIILGLARAIGEAIAVSQVIGGGLNFSLSVFQPADTLAGRVASQYQGSASDLQTASLAYLAVILLVMSLIANIGAQLIVRRIRRRMGSGH